MIALVRHPKLRGATGICYGRFDFPLQDPERDIPPIVARFCDWRAIVYSSPAPRCRVVAEAVGANVRIDPRLQELDFGAWEGLRWDDIPRSELDRWASDPLGFAPPGGESGATFIERLRGFVARLQGEADDVIIVTHGGPLKLLSPMLKGGVVDLLAPAPGFGNVEVIANRCTHPASS
jgi:alpha-ribazole phosphatase